jgi:hypothetical protein
MSTPSTYIHEDRGDNNNNKTLWFCLNGSINSVFPFIDIPNEPNGCQFINAHNKPISEVFNFNTNIQIGDVMQVFYSTLYTSKSTQGEGSKKQLRIGRAVVKRIMRLLDENQTNGCDETTSEPSFGAGLSRVLLGLNAATLRNVISSTMAHLISCNNRSQLVFLHEFSDLLVGRMEATLEGQDINVCIRTSKVPDGKLNVGQTFLLMITFTDLYKKNIKTFACMIRQVSTKQYTRFTDRNPFKCMNSVTVIQDISQSFIYIETFNYTKDSITTKQTMFPGRT